MKKVLLSLMGFALILTLAACGQSQVVVKKIEPKQTQQTQDKREEPKTKMTAKEVYDKTMKVAEGIQSYTATIDIDQEMFRGWAKTFTNNVRTEYKMITDPLAFYQKLSYDMVGESMFIELYSTEDGLYVYNEEEDMWGKFDAIVAEEFIAELEIENPLDELENLELFIDEFEMKESDDKYILALKEDSSEKFEEAMKKMADEAGPEDSLIEVDEQEWDYVIKNMEINKVDYKVVIDKATYYPLEIDVEMSMEVADESGRKTRMLQSIKGDYTDYNTLKEIEIPQEVVDVAVDMEFY